MRDSVPSVRYSSVCNVLRQWSISLIPTYRVYRLYDIHCVMLDRIYISTCGCAVMYSAGQSHFCDSSTFIP